MDKEAAAGLIATTNLAMENKARLASLLEAQRLNNPGTPEGMAPESDVGDLVKKLWEMLDAEKLKVLDYKLKPIDWTENVSQSFDTLRGSIDPTQLPPELA